MCMCICRCATHRLTLQQSHIVVRVLSSTAAMVLVALALVVVGTWEHVLIALGPHLPPGSVVMLSLRMTACDTIV